MNKIEIPDFSQTPTRRLLEQSRLSKFPNLPRRSSCANCGGFLDTSDDYQSAVKLCRKCLRNYANIGLILERYAETKIRRTYQEAA